MNDIQDKIIAGSHGEVTVFLPPASFIPDAVADPPVLLPGKMTSITGTDCYVRLGLGLPVGSVVNEIVFYFRTANTESGTVALKETDDITASGITANDVESKSTPTGATYETVTFDSGDTNIPYTVASNKPIWILLTIPATSIYGEFEFFGARLKYSKP